MVSYARQRVIGCLSCRGILSLREVRLCLNVAQQRQWEGLGRAVFIWLQSRPHNAGWWNLVNSKPWSTIHYLNFFVAACFHTLNNTYLVLLSFAMTWIKQFYLIVIHWICVDKPQLKKYILIFTTITSKCPIKIQNSTSYEEKYFFEAKYHLLHIFFLWNLTSIPASKCLHAPCLEQWPSASLL